MFQLSAGIFAIVGPINAIRSGPMGALLAVDSSGARGGDRGCTEGAEFDPYSVDLVALLTVRSWPRAVLAPMAATEDAPKGRVRPKAAVPRLGLSVRLCVRLLAGLGKDKLLQEQGVAQGSLCATGNI